MSSTVRFALVGVTHPHARGYLATLRLMPEVELVALFDESPTAARQALDPALVDVPLYGDLAKLLEEARPEAALIALPNDVTPSAVKLAAAAGVHVYVEKPCARTASEFAPAAEAIRRAGVQFSTGYLRRFSPAGLAIKGIVDDGLLGRLVSIEARWITTSVRRRDPAHFLFDAERSRSGILGWLGCHWLDFMRWSSSQEVVEVGGMLGTLSGETIGVEDSAALSLRYANGMLGTLHCAYVLDKEADHFYHFGLRGTMGWVRWEGSGPEIQVRSTHPDWATAPSRVLRFDPDPSGGYGGQQGIASVRQFIAAFRTSGCPAFTTDDALRVLEVIDAARESNRTGRSVAIGPAGATRA